MSVVFDILTVLGALGIFIYGMKIMSEGIQKVAGKSLRKILRYMTTNRLAGIMTGLFTTILVQSSSATTVMIVSFVNAGLLTLSQSIGVIMGANIGTTTTAWLISFLGFGKVQIVTYAMYVIGLAFPFLFSKRDNFRNLAEFVLGFGVLFIGLEFLKASVPDIRENPEILAFLNNYTDLGFLSIIIFVIVGTLLTVIIQSSSATMAITLIMVAEGWIGFPIAAAMVLGENIGTTITANLAALVGNVHAKRAARFHTMFNLLGVAWMLALFMPFLQFVDWLTDVILLHDVSIFAPYDLTVPEAELRGRQRVTTEGLAIFHSAFNIMNVLLLFLFVPIMERLVVRLLPSRGVEDEEFKLQYITSGPMATPELSMEEAKKEIHRCGKIVEKMCANSMMLYFKDANAEKLMKKIKRREEATDNLQMEITNYLAALSKYNLSEESASRVRELIRIVNELERMADIFYKMSLNKKRMIEGKITFPENVKNELEEYFDIIYKWIKEMNKNLLVENHQINMDEVWRLEDIVDEKRDNLKKKHFSRLEKAKYPVEHGLLFLDFVEGIERLGDHIVNVSQAIAGFK